VDNFVKNTTGFGPDAAIGAACDRTMTTGRPKDFEINTLDATPQNLCGQTGECQQRRGLWTHLHEKAP
jgi:hypothetical protein